MCSPWVFPHSAFCRCLCCGDLSRLGGRLHVASCLHTEYQYIFADNRAPVQHRGRPSGRQRLIEGHTSTIPVSCLSPETRHQLAYLPHATRSHTKTGAPWFGFIPLNPTLFHLFHNDLILDYVYQRSVTLFFVWYLLYNPFSLPYSPVLPCLSLSSFSSPLASGRRWIVIIIVSSMKYVCPSPSCAYYEASKRYQPLIKIKHNFLRL